MSQADKYLLLCFFFSLCCFLAIYLFALQLLELLVEDTDKRLWFYLSFTGALETAHREPGGLEVMCGKTSDLFGNLVLPRRSGLPSPVATLITQRIQRSITNRFFINASSLELKPV